MCKTERYWDCAELQMKVLGRVWFIPGLMCSGAEAEHGLVSSFLSTVENF